MPPIGRPFRALRGSVARGIVAALCWLATRLAGADHGGPASPARTGFDWTSWLLIGGAVAAVCLAAWAFFAPAQPDERPARDASRRPEPEATVPKTSTPQ